VTQSFGSLQPNDGRFSVRKVLPNAASSRFVLGLPRTPIRTEFDASNLFRSSCHRGCLHDPHRILGGTLVALLYR
jgi:hypothetical protein